MIPVKDYPSIKELPEVFDAAMLAETVDVTKWKSYRLFRDKDCPYFDVDGKKSIFKTHFIEWLSEQPLTPLENLEIIKNLPENFPPKLLLSVLAVSKSKIYSLIHSKNFPSMQLNGQIIVNKTYFISWLRTRWHINSKGDLR